MFGSTSSIDTSFHHLKREDVGLNDSKITFLMQLLIPASRKVVLKSVFHTSGTGGFSGFRTFQI